MKYMTGYVWLGQQNDDQLWSEWNEKDSVLLQQMLFDKTSIVLACVCDGQEQGGYLTGQLKIWLQHYIGMLTGGRDDRQRVKQALERELARINHDLKVYGQRMEGMQSVDFSGILIVEQDFWMFRGGQSEIWAFNRRFQRTHCRQLLSQERDSWQVAEGSLEKGVGILLVTEEFRKGSITESLCFSGEPYADRIECEEGSEAFIEVWKQCLAAQDIVREGQIERRLEEIAVEGRRRGYRGECAAIYIKSA